MVDLSEYSKTFRCRNCGWMFPPDIIEDYVLAGRDAYCEICGTEFISEKTFGELKELFRRFGRKYTEPLYRGYPSEDASASLFGVEDRPKITAELSYKKTRIDENLPKPVKRDDIKNVKKVKDNLGSFLGSRRSLFLEGTTSPILTVFNIISGGNILQSLLILAVVFLTSWSVYRIYRRFTATDSGYNISTEAAVGIFVGIGLLAYPVERGSMLFLPNTPIIIKGILSLIFGLLSVAVYVIEKYNLHIEKEKTDPANFKLLGLNLINNLRIGTEDILLYSEMICAINGLTAGGIGFIGYSGTGRFDLNIILNIMGLGILPIYFYLLGSYLRSERAGNGKKIFPVLITALIMAVLLPPIGIPFIIYSIFFRFLLKVYGKYITESDDVKKLIASANSSTTVGHAEGGTDYKAYSIEGRGEHVISETLNGKRTIGTVVVHKEGGGNNGYKGETLPIHPPIFIKMGKVEKPHEDFSSGPTEDKLYNPEDRKDIPPTDTPDDKERKKIFKTVPEHIHNRIEKLPLTEKEKDEILEVYLYMPETDFIKYLNELERSKGGLSGEKAEQIINGMALPPREKEYILSIISRMDPFERAEFLEYITGNKYNNNK